MKKSKNLQNFTTLGKIHVSRTTHGNFYCPRCVPGGNEYVVSVNGTRLSVYGKPSDNQKWYILKPHGYPRWCPKIIGISGMQINSFK